jgi:hypothetical protein
MANTGVDHVGVNPAIFSNTALDIQINGPPSAGIPSNHPAGNGLK